MIKMYCSKLSNRLGVKELNLNLNKINSILSLQPAVSKFYKILKNFNSNTYNSSDLELSKFFKCLKFKT